MWVLEKPSLLLLPSRLSSPPPPGCDSHTNPLRKGTLWGGGAMLSACSLAGQCLSCWSFCCSGRSLATHARPGPSSSSSSSSYPLSPPSLCAGHPPSAVTPSLPAACTTPPPPPPASVNVTRVGRCCGHLCGAPDSTSQPGQPSTHNDRCWKKSLCVPTPLRPDPLVCQRRATSPTNPESGLASLSHTPHTQSVSQVPRGPSLPLLPSPSAPGLGHRCPHQPPCLQARPAPIHSPHSNQLSF